MKNTLIYIHLFIALMVCSLLACKENVSRDTKVNKPVTTRSSDKKAAEKIDYDANLWEEITTENSGIHLDIRYATKNNFTEKVIYDCGRCFLRPAIAKKLKSMNRGIQARYGYTLKVFDCYRPRPAQQKLWDIVPDARYVTPPAKGSMHNRGMAVDITLLDEKGNEMDMGTGYDYFGEEAHTDNNNLPDKVLKNRKILQSMMKEIGFKTIRTEWWHFSYHGELYPLDGWVWECY